LCFCAFMYTFLLASLLFVTFSCVSFFDCFLLLNTHTNTLCCFFSSFATPCFRIYVYIYMYLSHSLRTKKSVGRKLGKLPYAWSLVCYFLALFSSCVFRQMASILLFEFFTYNKRSVYFFSPTVKRDRAQKSQETTKRRWAQCIHEYQKCHLILTLATLLSSVIEYNIYRQLKIYFI